MDNESTNWCLLAQTIRYKGGEVLRQFLLLEILTMIFNNCSRFWMNKLHNPTGNDYLTLVWNNLNGTLKMSQICSDKTLNELLKSWTTVRGNEISLMEQIERFKQWRNDITEKRSNSVSSSVDNILKSWSSNIEHEIQELNPTCKVLCQWNNTFHGLLQNGQKGLLLEIEKNDGFLSRCSHKLRSLSSPSCTDFQQIVRQFKGELNIWKVKCGEVLQKFRQEFLLSIASWLLEAQGVPQRYAIVKFLNRLKTEIEDWNFQSHVDLFCDKWDDDLHNVFDRYERQIQDGVSTEDNLSLVQGLCKELEQFSSFKDKKIRDFFSCFNPPKFPRILNIQVSELKYISSSSDLNKLDFTILIAVWKSGNLLHTPRQDRDEDTHDWDTSVTADILRLRKHRNNIIDHIAELRISRNIFETLWKELTISLSKIASQCGDKFIADISREICQMRDGPFVHHSLYELQKECLTWCKNDILAQLSVESAPGRKCLNMLEHIQMALENLSRNRAAHWCRICNVECDTEFALEKHMQRHKAHVCSICNTGCYTEMELKQHMGKHHAQTCRICDVQLDTELELEQHMWSHVGYHCGMCVMGCSKEMTNFEFIVHTHRFFKMKHCNCSDPTHEHDYHHWGYPRKFDWEQHLGKHQAHSCLSCNEDFSSENELEKHMRCHQAHSCLSCNEDFSSENELEKHMRCHQDRTFCSCLRYFSADSELAEHVGSQKDCPKGTIWFLNSIFRNEKNSSMDQHK